jgi:hypothetical protein
MKLANAANLNRKSGVAQWRDLLFYRFATLSSALARKRKTKLPPGTPRMDRGECFSSGADRIGNIRLSERGAEKCGLEL